MTKELFFLCSLEPLFFIHTKITFLFLTLQALGGGGGGCFLPRVLFFACNFFVLEPIFPKFGNFAKI